MNKSVHAENVLRGQSFAQLECTARDLIIRVDCLSLSRISMKLKKATNITWGLHCVNTEQMEKRKDGLTVNCSTTKYIALTGSLCYSLARTKDFNTQTLAASTSWCRMPGACSTQANKLLCQISRTQLILQHFVLNDVLVCVSSPIQ